MSNVLQLIKSQPPQAKKMNDGFILLFRDIQKQPWYKNSEYKSVFIHLLLKASYKPVQVSFHGCQVNLLPGQLASSYEQLARELGLTKALVQRAVKKFKSLGQISTLSFKNYTVIMISKWPDFQQKSDTPIDTVSDTLEPYIEKGLESKCDTVSDTASDTQNNNTLSKDRVKNTCSEQSSEPEKKFTKIILPLNKKDTFHNVSQEDFDEYLELYPSVDVLQQLRLMFRWFKDNPKRKKTKAGIQRFISSWLGKEQNRGGSYSAKPVVDHNDTSWADGFKVKL